MTDTPTEVIARTLRHTTIGTICAEGVVENFAELVVAALTQADWTIVPAWDEIDRDRFRTWRSMSPGDAADLMAWLDRLVGGTDGPASTYVQTVRRCRQDGRLEVDVFIDVDDGDSSTETRFFADLTPPAWPSPSV